MRTVNHLLVFLLLVPFCGCRGGGFVLSPDEADEKIGLPGSNQNGFGAIAAYEHATRGEILAARGDHNGAALEFEVALASDPGDFLLRARLAESYVELGDYKRAKHHIEKILKWDQASELGWVALAKYHKARGEMDRAEKAARRAMRVEPSGLVAPLWLARHYRDLGDHNRSAEILQGALLTNPNRADVRLELAEELMALERRFEAREHLEVFVRLRPFRSDVIRKIALLSIEAGDKLGASELFEIALSRDPSNHEMRLELIQLQLELNLKKRAVRNLDSLPLPRESDVEGGVRRACLFAKAGQAYRARTLLLDQLGSRPEDPMATLALADIEVELGRLETAKLLVETTNYKWTTSQVSQKDSILKKISSWPNVPEPCNFLTD